MCVHVHFPQRISAGGKESACNVEDPGLKIPWRGEQQNSLWYSCLENSMGTGATAGYSLWGRKESDTTEQLTPPAFSFTFWLIPSQWEKLSLFYSRSTDTIHQQPVSTHKWLEASKLFQFLLKKLFIPHLFLVMVHVLWTLSELGLKHDSWFRTYAPGQLPASLSISFPLVNRK